MTIRLSRAGAGGTGGAGGERIAEQLGAAASQGGGRVLGQMPCCRLGLGGHDRRYLGGCGQGQSAWVPKHWYAGAWAGRGYGGG
jgi:hypothetical protein